MSASKAQSQLLYGDEVIRLYLSDLDSSATFSALALFVFTRVSIVRLTLQTNSDRFRYPLQVVGIGLIVNKPLQRNMSSVIVAATSPTSRGLAQPCR